MPDRIDREIEEILARLGEDSPKRGEEPISLDERRRQKKAPVASRAVAALGLSLSGPTAASMLFTGAGVMVVGLILSAIWGTLIWVAFAGVVLFVAAFIWSFVRPSARRRPEARRERSPLAGTLRRVRARATRPVGADQTCPPRPLESACARYPQGSHDPPAPLCGRAGYPSGDRLRWRRHRRTDPGARNPHFGGQACPHGGASGHDHPNRNGNEAFPSAGVQRVPRSRHRERHGARGRTRSRHWTTRIRVPRGQGDSRVHLRDLPQLRIRRRGHGLRLRNALPARNRHGQRRDARRNRAQRRRHRRAVGRGTGPRGAVSRRRLTSGLPSPSGSDPRPPPRTDRTTSPRSPETLPDSSS